MNAYLNNLDVPDTSYHNMFTQIMSPENIYDRRVLYEGHKYHKADQFFGNTIDNSRLTLVFFVNNINAINKSFVQNRMKAIDT
jgi:hypothetical protein